MVYLEKGEISPRGIEYDVRNGPDRADTRQEKSTEQTMRPYDAERGKLGFPSATRKGGLRE